MSSSDHNFEAYDPNVNNSASIDYSMRDQALWNNANQNELINGISSNIPANIEPNTSNNDDFVLENLFANALLSDDFSKQTVEFADCLGFESLHLNLNEPSIASTSTHIAQPITNSSDHSTQLETNRPIECSLNFLNSQPALPSLVELSTVNMNSDLTIVEQLSLETPSSNQTILATNIHQQEQIKEQNGLLSLNGNLNGENLSFVSSNNTNSALLNDDKLFKRPSINFINVNHLDFNSISTTASSTSSIQSVNTSNFHSQLNHINELNNFNILTNENVLKLKLLNSTSTSLFSSSSSSSSNEFTRKQFKEIEITKSTKKSPPSIESKKTNILVDDCKSFINHNHANKIPLKRSRQAKKSKLLKNSAVLSGNQAPQEHKHVNKSDEFVLVNKQLHIFKQTKSNLNPKVKKIDKKEKVNSKKGIKMNDFEPSNKKLAIDLKSDDHSTDSSENKKNFIVVNSGDSFITSSCCTGAYHGQNGKLISNMNSKVNLFHGQIETPGSTSTELGSFSSQHWKREDQKEKEVDLQIKELSLLDLYSSEEDSIDFRLKKDLNGLANGVTSKIIKKNTRSCSSEQTRIMHSPPQSTNAGLKLNELISKRIKYSPTKPSSPIALQHDLSEEDSKQDTYYTKSNSTDHETSNRSQLCSSSLPVSGSESEKPVSISLDGRKKNQMTQMVKSNEYSKFQTKRQKNDNSVESTAECIEKKLIMSQTKGQRDDERSKNDPVILISVSPTATPSSSSISNAHSTSMNAKNEANFCNDELIKSFSFENETITIMKNLDINNDIKKYKSQENLQETQSTINDTSSTATSTAFHMASKMAKNSGNNANQANSGSKSSTCDINFKLNLKDSNSRSYLWNLLKTHCTLDELINQFGAILHDKISFWDLVQLKLKFSQKSQIKTTYEIIEDYTVLYSNVSSLLERIVEEHSSESLSLSNRKSENSSRSRSSSRSFSRNNRKSNNSIK